MWRLESMGLDQVPSPGRHSGGNTFLSDLPLELQHRTSELKNKPLLHFGGGEINQKKKDISSGPFEEMAVILRLWSEVAS